MKRFSLGLVLFSFVGLGYAQSTLSLTDYLGQVEAKGPGFQSAQAAVEGYEKQSHQQDLTYSPLLTAGYNHSNDSEPLNGLTFPKTLTDTAGVSITDKLPFGPSVYVGYEFQNTNITYPPIFSELGSSSGFLSSYYQIAPVVGLTLPLFKDFGGSQTAAGVHMVQYQLESQEKNSAFQREQTLYAAKVAYWNLALTQESVSIRQSSLDRSQEIWEWTKKRVNRNLAEAPDALQAEASVRLAELDLQLAQEAGKTARLQFNRYRAQSGDTVAENLEPLEQSLRTMVVSLPDNPDSRLDLKAAQDTVKQQQAAYDQAYQNIYPDISLNASWRGNGVDPSYGNANQTAWQFTYPTWTLGAQFNLPLDVFTAQTVADGYKKNFESAKLSLKDKEVQVGQDWTQLKNQLQDVDRRLDMTAEIESIQKNKADEERKRLEYGRTTEFQLLSFETDYNTARLNHLGVISEKLSILAQAQWWLATDLHIQGEKQ